MRLYIRYAVTPRAVDTNAALRAEVRSASAIVVRLRLAGGSSEDEVEISVRRSPRILPPRNEL